MYWPRVCSIHTLGMCFLNPSAIYSENPSQVSPGSSPVIPNGNTWKNISGNLQEVPSENNGNFKRIPSVNLAGVISNICLGIPYRDPLGALEEIPRSNSWIPD